MGGVESRAKLVLAIGLVVVPMVLVLVFPVEYFRRRDGNVVLLGMGCGILGLVCCVLVLTICTNTSLFVRETKETGKGSSGENCIVAVRGSLMRLRYCETCNIYRPPRTVHCAVCDICIEGFDHHCPWLGICIGRRNYLYFLFLLSLLSAQYLFCLCICSAHLYSLAQEEDWSDAVGSIVAMGSAGVVGVMVLGLWGFHMYLCSVAQTTYERVRYTWSVYNPYSAPSILSNWYQTCFSKRTSRPKLPSHPFSTYTLTHTAPKASEQAVADNTHTRLSSVTGVVDLEPLKEDISRL